MSGTTPPTPRSLPTSRLPAERRLQNSYGNAHRHALQHCRGLGPDAGGHRTPARSDRRAKSQQCPQGSAADNRFCVVWEQSSHAGATAPNLGIRNVMMQPRSLLRSRRFAESSKSRFSAPSPHIISKSPLTQYKRPPESSPPKFFRYLSRRQFTPYCASSDLTSGRFKMC
jgi:hypothetical protein